MGAHQTLLEGTVPGVILHWERVAGSAPAIVFRERTTSYSDLARAMRSVAGFLITEGIAPGDRVGLLMPPSDNWAAIHYGVMLAGAIVVPINLSLKAEELRFVLRQSRAQYLICADRYRNDDLAARLEEIVPELRTASAGGLAPPEFPHLRGGALISVEGQRRGGWKSFREMLSFAPSEEISQEINRRLHSMKSTDNCAIVYTSGSTSFPKPALLHHRGLLGGAWWYGEGSAIDGDERILVLAPTFHVSGISAGMLVSHVRGLAAWLMEGFEAGQALEIIERERITMFSGFDTMFIALMSHPSFSAAKVASIRSLRLATGPAMYDRVYAAFPNLRTTARCYAMTETCGPTAVTFPSMIGTKAHKYSNGIAIPGIEFRIADPEDGTSLPPGKLGEIRIKAWNLFHGYFEMPRETAAAFDDEGWFKTGDLGVIDETGLLTLDGRLKRIIKTGGENVSEREVEIFLEDKVPGVNHAQVVGIPDPIWGEAVIAFVEPLPGASLSEDGIREACRTGLANFKVPKRIHLVANAEWPRNAVSKISKDALIEMAKQHAVASSRSECQTD